MVSPHIPSPPSRDELAARYLDTLPFDPYPVQEEALLAWFMSEQGVLVCAPTGTGKTVIAEAALFEALHTGRTAYYTTPLIALTEQKFREMQTKAAEWGFHPHDVGLVTGNRRENPDARVLVVVAEILFNRLLHQEVFDFSRTGAVVMDEFHSFADPERGVVWELSLGLLPSHVRLLLLSATVGNAAEFTNWLRRSHDRSLELIQSDERRVPLTYCWAGERLLNEQIEAMASGAERLTPALVFCFNREECWTIAEQLRGKGLLAEGQQSRLADALARYDWSQGAGPKLKQILLRGVGVHHAGILPKYRRIVEDLFQQKLLSVATCTETLSAGINLPARSVVLPSLMKGPPEKKRLIEPSTAHQIFGRAGRPQYDTRGFVFALPHEDDVKIARWREKYDQIPEDTKDPGLIKAKKAMKKKMPKRRATQQYWNEAQFEKLRRSPPGKLYSKGPLPWRLLAYMIDAESEIDPMRALVGKRLMEGGRGRDAQKDLDRMLLVLHKGGFVRLEPPPPLDAPARDDDVGDREPPPGQELGTLGRALAEAEQRPVPGPAGDTSSTPDQEDHNHGAPRYRPERAHATPELIKLTLLRSIHPVYGVFLVNQLGIADRAERLQAFESVLELPGSVAHFVRVPPQDQLPPGPLATTRLDSLLLQLGLATEAELVQQQEEDHERRPRSLFDEQRTWVLPVADKLRRLFQYEYPGVHDLKMRPAWAAGELLELGGNFNKYVTAKQLQKQEGIVFRHILRLILLLREVKQLTPPDVSAADWQAELDDLGQRLIASCRDVDATSTDRALAKDTGPTLADT